jgi:hypothetical protein
MDLELKSLGGTVDHLDVKEGTTANGVAIGIVP